MERNMESSMETGDFQGFIGITGLVATHNPSITGCSNPIIAMLGDFRGLTT